jgi:starch synthase
VESLPHHISVLFHPANAHDSLVRTLSDSPGNRFRCDEIRAEFSPKKGAELTLHGVIDERVPYKGVLRKDTKSEKYLLSYLAHELDKSTTRKNPDIEKALIGLTEAIESIEFETKETTAVLGDLVEVFASDFTWIRARKKNYEVSSLDNNRMKASSLSGKTITVSPRVVILNKDSKSISLPYEVVSGFLAIEVSVDAATPNIDNKNKIPASLAERVRFLPHTASYMLSPDGAFLRVSIRASDALDDVSFFFHIGKNDGNPNPWADYEGSIVTDDHNNIIVQLPLGMFSSGKYEYTCYAYSRVTKEAVWMGSFGHNKSFALKKKIQMVTSHNPITKIHNRVPLGSYISFSVWCRKKINQGYTGAILAPLFENLESRQLLSQYYEEALKRITKRKSEGAVSVIRMIRTLGLSSVIMVSPEGPHAIAGGLAQVIVGLSEVLSNEGLELTLISPLYEEACGNHHISFKEATTKGISLFGKLVRPSLKGEIRIDIPATHWRKNKGIATPRRVLKVEIYEISVRNIRILFLRHKTLGDRLYGGISAKDQILRALFLSRGAIELCRDPAFEVTPGIIISHDWLPSLISPLLSLDETYKEDERLQLFSTIHMLHNVGKAYQGRFPVSENEEDLWPLFGLGTEHLYGFLDEEYRDVINITKASCLHNSKALITVSKPYAEQLLEKESGEGLHSTLQDKQGTFYGISNGIPQEAVRNAGLKRVAQEVPSLENPLSSVKEIVLRKNNLKTIIQKENGLTVDKNALLGVFVGRLTEQKGLGLLSSLLENGYSVIEQTLRTFPQFQIIIAGPPSRFDNSFLEFEALFKRLQSKYPGRCAERFEFVPHTYAIELTAAANLFLMPSRYEPGGITQLEALSVGTTVVAHRVGGLSATLAQFKKTSGNSFLFDAFTVDAFWQSLKDASEHIVDESTAEILVERALEARNDWEHRVPYYLSLFQKVIGIFDMFPSSSSSFTASRIDLLSRVTARI